MNKSANIDLLLVGAEDDFNLRHIEKIAISENINVKTCYTGVKTEQKIHLDIQNNIFTINGYDVETKGLFMRPDVTTFQKTGRRSDQYLAYEWFEIFMGWAIANDSIKIFNRNYFNRNKTNKIATLLIAKQLGIEIGDTFFSNDYNFLKERCDDKWIEKPVKGGAHTKLLENDNLLPISDNLVECPLTVQKKLLKPEYRFFRIGNKYFAFTMDSPSLDYREKQDAKVEQVEFPKEYLENYVALTNRLGLNYAAADYITNPETGNLALLEVNSGAMFAAFDVASQNVLCREMVRYLAK